MNQLPKKKICKCGKDGIHVLEHNELRCLKCGKPIR